MTEHVTMELDERTLTTLDGFAAAMELSRTGMIDRALKEWLAGQADFVAQVQAGIADADAGRFVDDDEIARIVRKFDGGS